MSWVERLFRKNKKNEEELAKKNLISEQDRIALEKAKKKEEKEEEEEEKKEEEKKKKNEKPVAPEMNMAYSKKLKRYQDNCQAATWTCKAIAIPLTPIAIALAFNPLTAIFSAILLGICSLLLVAGIWVLPEMKDGFEEAQIKEDERISKEHSAKYKEYVKECFEKGYEPEGNNNTFTQSVDYDYGLINQSMQNAAQAAQQDAQPQK